MPVFLDYLVAFYLILMNGFFVVAEFSLVRLDSTRVESFRKKKGIRGKLLYKIYYHLDAYLSACQLGITFSSLGLGWISQIIFSDLAQYLSILIHMENTFFSRTLLFFSTFFIISYLHIVIGELAPKSLAIRLAGKIAYNIVIPLYIFYKVFYPIIWILNNSARILLLLFKMPQNIPVSHSYTPDELKFILTTSHSQGKLDLEQAKILSRTLDFSDLTVVDVMRSIEEMRSIDFLQPIPQILQFVSEHQYSRYPVYEGSLDHIRGLIHVKDLFATLQRTHMLTDLRPLLRPILTVESILPVTELFKQFQQGYSHFAIVKSHSGHVIGFVTLDNILGNIFGSIRDEFNETKQDWVHLKDGSFLVKGNLPLSSLEKIIGSEISDLDAETISGLILHHLERFPHLYEQISFPAFDIKIQKMKGPRILQVLIYPRKNHQK